MTRKTCAVVISFMVLAAVAGHRAFGADAKGVDAKAAFDRLKSLEGTWTSEAQKPGHGAHDKPHPVTYRVTANGSVLMETVFPGSNHEMVTMYHLDGDDLLLTHYCALKNQPRLKLDKAASTPEKLVFAFDGGTGFDPAKDMHMHSAWFDVHDAKRIESEWTAYKGKEKLESAKFVLTRP
jgi:hypothetical protein